MFEAETLSDWIGLPVVDFDEDKVGTLESIYYDTSSSLPAYAAVQMGILGGKKLAFVPLVGALVSPKHLKVRFAKDLIKSAPSIATDGQLEASMEPTIYSHYEQPYQTGSNGERRLGRR
jgi:hypothetical protein